MIIREAESGVVRSSARVLTSAEWFSDDDTGDEGVVISVRISFFVVGRLASALASA